MNEYNCFIKMNEYNYFFLILIYANIKKSISSELSDKTNWFCNMFTGKNGRIDRRVAALKEELSGLKENKADLKKDISEVNNSHFSIIY